MADSWEDDDFNVSAVGRTAVPVSWDDEEDDEVGTSTVAPGTAPKMSVTKAAKVAADRDARVAAELEARLQLGETEEQRRLRERNREEEADNVLTEDLFGGKGGAGLERSRGDISSIPLRTMQDHVKLAVELSERLDASKPTFVAAFVKELISKLSGKMTADELTNVVNLTSVFRHKKRETEQRIAMAKTNTVDVQAIQRTNKKKKEAQKKMHADVFGDVDDDDVDNLALDYEDQYDFM